MTEELKQKIIINIVIILVTIFLNIGIKRTFKKVNKKLDDKAVNKKQKTYIRLISNILNYLTTILLIVIILQVNGINISSLIAGIGIISAIVGLAIQDALKDFIMGFNILTDSYFHVGDTLKIDDIEGKVIQIGLKSIKLKDINNENIYVISNRNVDKALTESDLLDIDLPLPYEENISNVEDAINEICTRSKEEITDIQQIKYMGLNEFGDSAIYYKIRLYTKPENKPQIKRNINRIIKIVLDERKIEIPYNQIDIHNKC